MAGYAYPLLMGDLFCTKINMLAPVCPLLTNAFLPWCPGSCDGRAGKLLLPWSHLTLLQISIMSFTTHLVCLFMEIHRLARFKTIYSNNNNNNDSPVLISGHVMKSQQPCVAGMGNALKFHQLKPLTGESLNDCGRSTAWTKPQGRSAIEEIGLTPPLLFILLF